jgi:hypothetical protein
MHFKFHAGQRDLYLVDAIEHRSYTLQVDRGGQLLDKVLLHGSTRLRETIDVIPRDRGCQLMVSFSDKELIANIVPPLQLVPQAFYAAASGILRRLQRQCSFSANRVRFGLQQPTFLSL